ncbi:MAG: DNA repair protein RecO [Thermoanaerobaculia bacterium]|nr:DNA repair protein RecO [Thermoanaerobaculia bacterium]
MRLYSDEAFILEVGDLSDADRFVAFMTRERGTQRGAASGAKRRFSRYAGQFQPLAKVKVTWAEKEGRELVRLRSVELLRPAQKLLEDLEGILLACYLAELVLVFAPDSEENEVIFRLLDSTVVSLLAGADRNLAGRYFEVWMLRLAGIFPIPRECPECGGSLEAGAVLPPSADHLVCGRCGSGAGGMKVDSGVIDLLIKIHRTSLAELALIEHDPNQLARLERLAGAVRRAFLQHELKSYEVMQRTLG